MMEVKDITDIKEGEERLVAEAKRIEGELNSIAMQAAYYGCRVSIDDVDVSQVGLLDYKIYTIGVTKKLN